MKKVKSARGEIVDFNLLKIKEQIASAPATTEVRARQDFIDKRLRRRVKTVQPPPQKIEVDPTMPQPDTTETVADEKPTEKTVAETTTTTTKQKARPKTEGESK